MYIYMCMGLACPLNQKAAMDQARQKAKTPKADNPPVLDPDPRQGILLISRKQQIHTVLGGTLKYPPTSSSRIVVVVVVVVGVCV